MVLYRGDGIGQKILTNWPQTCDLTKCLEEENEKGMSKNSWLNFLISIIFQLFSRFGQVQPSWRYSDSKLQKRYPSMRQKFTVSYTP